MFLKTKTYWASIVPILIIFPFVFYVTIEENKSELTIYKLLASYF